MPKNIITEILSPSPIIEERTSNTVFIPIHTTDAIEPTLCETVRSLDSLVLGKLVTTESLEYSLNLGYKLCKHLIANGLTIIVQGVTTALPEINWTQLEDKNLYDLRFLTTGALKVDLSQDMITSAKNRGDCTAIISFNESDPTFEYDVETVKGLVSSVTHGDFAAAFTPAFYTKHESFITEEVVGEKVLIPAGFGYLFAYARSIKNNPEWFAIAGFERGLIPELSELAHNFTSAEINELQNRTDSAETDNEGIAINAIGYIRPAGNVIYGNRTLRNNDANTLTPTSFLNVRNMISTVKKIAFEAGNRFTFEQNSEVLWVNYKSYIEPTLDRITHGNGAVGYEINRINTNIKAKMEAEIIIEPIEAVEDIELFVIMTDTSTAVNE